MKQIKGQMSLFDFLEPEVGECVTKHGAVICHIMREGMIGKKVVWSCGTQSMPDLCKVGILEKVLPDKYYRYYNGEYVERPCDRAILYTGKKQRSSLLLMPGTEIYECLAWDKYPARMAAIGLRAKED